MPNPAALCRTIVAAVPALLVGSAIAAPTAAVTTHARYQSFAGDDAATVSFIGEVAKRNVLVHPPTTPFAPSLSRAYARSTIGGSVGALVIAGGWNPGNGPPNQCEADATARSTTIWNIRSDSLPAATPISIRVDFRVHGVLGFGDFAGGTSNDPSASVAATLHANGASIFNASYRVASGGSVGPRILQFTGGWSGADVTDGDFAYPGFDGPFPGHRLDATRTFTLPSAVGDSLELSSFLEVHARTRGPNELFSFSDFSNSAGYTLTAVNPDTGSPLGVQFIAVPGPGAAAVFAVALLAASPRRRRGSPERLR